MPTPELLIREAADWLRNEALRYVLIAQDHAARAELITHGTDKIPANTKRGADLQRCAEAAKQLADQFLGYAMAVSALAPPTGDLPPGSATHLPATFLRRCAAEDYPDQALFRLPLGDVVRAPLASPQAVDLSINQRRSA